MRLKSFFLLPVLFSAAACGPRDGEYTIHLFTTNDVHGTYFDSTYVSERTRPSLMAVSHYVDSVRAASGEENVIFIDAGDCLQGDNAAYYYNYVDTVSRHLYARIAEYMGYDAIVAGNHDIETGHNVYDRIMREMDVPFLAANAVRTDNGRPYFQDYVIVRRHGLKIAILGFTNPGIPGWLSEELWSGMEFRSLLPYVQEYVDKVISEERPDVVVAAVHSGTGNGDGSMLESQGLDLFRTLRGVDFLVCSHDHRPYVAQNDSICLINSGSHCRNIGHGTVRITVKGGKCTARSLSAELIPVRKEAVDAEMEALFRKDYDAVRAFTLKPVGELDTELLTRDAYRGMCPYMDLLHTVSLSVPEADISFAAPLTFNGRVGAGTILYNDLFTIYPFENQLFVVRMTGKEIKDYLEYSYDTWIKTVDDEKDGHLLKIVREPDPRTGQDRWSFVGRAYNFDSAGGLVYTVDVTMPAGGRVSVKSLADGSPFSEDAEDNGAMTSYRASGGGSLMEEGAGIDAAEVETRIVARYPEIRELVYGYILENGGIYAEKIKAPAVTGGWSFIPESISGPMLERDMALLFD